MAKVRAPLFGFDARKSLGREIFYARDKRRTLAKRKFTPRDPRSADQLTIRTAMTELQAIWRALDPIPKSSWENYMKEYFPGTQSRYSLFLKKNFAQYLELGTWDEYAPIDMPLIDDTRNLITDNEDRPVLYWKG